MTVALVLGVTSGVRALFERVGHEYAGDGHFVSMGSRFEHRVAKVFETPAGWT